LPLILGLMPVLPRHAVDVATFEETTMTGLVGSGPYRVGAVKPGASVTLIRNPDYWGRDLPVNRGLWNFDEVKIDFYRESNGQFEAFKRGLYDFKVETEPLRWHDGYDFPAVREWLSFTPEREFARFSSLVVGLASASPSASLAPFLRPVDETYHGHFHAIVTAFRSLPRGKLPVADVVSSWLQPRSVISVVHLLRDARPVEGAGESEFQRGACWIFPIADGGAA